MGGPELLLTDNCFFYRQLSSYLFTQYFVIRIAESRREVYKSNEFLQLFSHIYSSLSSGSVHVNVILQGSLKSQRRSEVEHHGNLRR